MRRLAGAAVVVGLAVVVAACVPPPAPPAPAPYLDQVYTNVAVTPKASGIVYGAAPPVDPKVGTPNENKGRQVDTNGNELLHLWAVNPVDNATTNRPRSSGSTVAASSAASARSSASPPAPG